MRTQAQNANATPATCLRGTRLSEKVLDSHTYNKPFIIKQKKRLTVQVTVIAQ